MKPKADFDPMFRPGPRRRWPIAWIGVATIAMGVGGLPLRAGPIAMRSQVSPPRVAPGPAAPAVRRPDRFVIVAPAWIDPAMVVRARADIDPEMVFDPVTRRRGTWPILPTPIPGVPAPVPGSP